MSSHLEMAGTWRAGESQLSQVLCSDDLGGRTGYDEEHGEEHRAIEQTQHQQRHQDQEEIPDIIREDEVECKTASITNQGRVEGGPWGTGASMCSFPVLWLLSPGLPINF